MPFEIQATVGLIVYLHSLKYVRHLRTFGRLDYVSKHMRYAIIYVSADDEADTIKKLTALNYVKQVVPSKLNELVKEVQGKDPTELDEKFEEDFND
ncbi:YlbG family protein [Lentilactobacillus farraginis]|uniref:Hypothetica protein n=2 Tax=Lentilactobacillus farraginis DSM 18382 = JCM 14108 TaxID=1423743 RepID=X0QAU0_9LACO|nr:YlbG family protein [Lentilactobacillus farraginis]GAF35725.1 hypothetica protein [Lentilactobacillus farraginis DSM 18382 = JCM 14108]